HKKIHLGEHKDGRSPARETGSSKPQRGLLRAAPHIVDVEAVHGGANWTHSRALQPFDTAARVAGQSRDRRGAGSGRLRQFGREGPTSVWGTPHQELRKPGAKERSGAFLPEGRRKLRRNGKRSAGV